MNRFTHSGRDLEYNKIQGPAIAAAGAKLLSLDLRQGQNHGKTSGEPKEQGYPRNWTVLRASLTSHEMVFLLSSINITFNSEDYWDLNINGDMPSYLMGKRHGKHAFLEIAILSRS